MRPRLGRSRHGFGFFPTPLSRMYRPATYISNLFAGLHHAQGGPQLLRQVAQPHQLYIPGMTAGEAISAGDVVYLSAANTVRKATDSTANRYKVIGVAAHSAALNEKVYVISYGAVEVTADGAIGVGDLVMAAATPGRVKVRGRVHVHEIPDYDTSHSHSQGNTGSATPLHFHNVPNLTGTITVYEADAPALHSHALAAHDHGNAANATQGASQAAVLSRTAKGVATDSHTHTTDTTGGSHSHTNPITGTAGGIHDHGGATTTDRDPGSPTTLDFIPGSIVGKAITSTTAAGQKLVILVTLA